MTAAPIVLAATPLTGHIRPVLKLARHLVAAGRRVTVVSGSRFAPQAAAAGAAFVPLAGPADFDDRHLNELQPWLHELAPGPEFLQAMFGWFTDMAPTQNAVLQEVLAEQPDAAVVHEAAFYGTWPQLLGAPGIRPRRTVGLGVFPLTLSGAELTMMGPPPPRAGLDVRGAAAAFNAELAAQLASATAHAQQVMSVLGATATLPVISDAQVLLPDVFAQLTVPSFEYPRVDAPPTLRLVGALPPEPLTAWEPPSWWPELSQRRVVALTQGTVANHDLTDLVQPTLDALADEDVLVVAALGGREIVHSDLRVPPNAYIESFIPFDALFPLADAVVTNGGYGGVQLALHHGVPLVVAGGSEDKPAVAARVADFGVGVDLRTGRPETAAVGQAVRRVLDEAAFRRRARELSADYQAAEPVRAILDIIDGA
ncbi:nucleotide disphospho-sugar-binding domain-containing protein [Streptomyces cellostaticus]|uniref:nucleotide disphospho-sugar-binding domain-containing protein n=1 Tax=Streptomyces cellostaticus TaxID=67285 RepID=UPI0020273D95|nr:glycosyltransferase [Streptomyces cellostaticus]